MAVASVTAAAANPALQGLIESLAPNTPPTPPPAWPPAPIVWIGLVVLFVLLAYAVYWTRRTRERRRYLRTLRQLRRDRDSERLLKLHRLLRNASAYRDPSRKSLTDADFARLVADSLRQPEPPAWVNAHYRPGPAPDIDWRQAKRLVRRWCV